MADFIPLGAFGAPVANLPEQAAAIPARGRSCFY
jgi:hypothetical protein